MEQDLKIVYLSPKELTPYEHNARKHAEEDLATIRASVKEFGFLDPIGIWGDKNIIVEGHGRQLVALKMGMDKVPCIRLDKLTDEQRRAYALAHNKTAEMSEWDFDKLDSELKALEPEINMEQFGFVNAEEQRIDELLDIPQTTENIAINFTLEQAEAVKSALREIKTTNAFKKYHNQYNVNSNGNALYIMVEQWQAQKR